VLEARSVVVRVAPTVRPVVVVGLLVVPAVAMAVHVESLQEKSAPLVGLVAAAEDPVRVLCRMWEPATENIYRKPHTSMLGLEVILTPCDQEEISPALSQVVAC